MNKYITAIIAVFLFCKNGFCDPVKLSSLLKTSYRNCPLIIIEGEILLDKEEDQIEKVIKSTLPERNKVHKIADLCDYDCLDNSGAYIFFKKYSDKNELPCITSDELVEYAADLRSKMKSKFNLEYQDMSVYIHNFVKSLPPNQWEAIQKGGINSSTLSDTSKKHLFDLFGETFYGTLRNGCDLVGANVDFSEKSLAYLEKEDDNNEYLKYKNGKNKNPSNVGWTIFTSEFQAPSKDRVLYLKRCNISFTDSDNIGSVIQLLNKRLGVEKYVVSNPLRKKPLSVVGIESGDTDKIFRSIALLYDLSLTKKDSVSRLSQKKITLLNDQDFGKAVLGYMPFPIRRVLNRESFSVATKQILTILRTQVTSLKIKKIPGDNIEELYRVAITLDIASKMISEIKDNDMYRMDFYDQHFNELVLKCQRIPGKLLTFSVMRNSNGKLISGPEYTTSRDVKREE